MTEYRPDGRRRMDRVLDPAFVEGLASVSHDELRGRREAALEEEQEVSYLRRLLQGRLDLLRTDLRQRDYASGDRERRQARPDAELVEELTSALRETPTAARTARLVDVEAPRSTPRRRAAEVAVDDVRLSDPSSLSDEDLEAVVTRLESLERQASATRRAVLAVLDTLTQEMQRRVLEGAMSPDLSA